MLLIACMLVIIPKNQQILFYLEVENYNLTFQIFG